MPLTKLDTTEDRNFAEGETVFDVDGNAYTIRDRIAVLNVNDLVRYALCDGDLRFCFSRTDPTKRKPTAQLPPGPWTADNDPQICEIWDANGALVAETSEFVRELGGARRPNRTDEEVLAIGQAIAAVPKMVESLVDIRNRVLCPVGPAPTIEELEEIASEALKLAGIES